MKVSLLEFALSELVNAEVFLSIEIISSLKVEL